jgi:hypothetical protein
MLRPMDRIEASCPQVDAPKLSTCDANLVARQASRRTARPKRGGNVLGMRIAAFALVCCATACAAWRDSSTVPDASPDTPPEASPCGAGRLVTSELVDFDSTASQPIGVFNARFTAEGMPAQIFTTALNGRFDLCVHAKSPMIFDVDAPAAYLDGKAYIGGRGLGLHPLSFRALTQARASTLYTFDANRGHVLVFLAGDRSDLTLDRAHGPPLAGDDEGSPGTYTWAPGNGGRYVLFPNVDVSSPTVTLTGDPYGPHTIPVAAGKQTFVAIWFVYL